jgi:hypothetical protein
MKSGYVYALKNKSLKNNIIKIGETSRAPDIRAKEIYCGATGVPEPFDVAYACSVCDCKLAEIKMHELLDSYRVNQKREFFAISITIAKKFIKDICIEINAEYDKLGKFKVKEIDCTAQKIKKDDVPFDYESLVYIDINDLNEQHLNTSVISSVQKNRIKLIAGIFQDVFPDTMENWINSFLKDDDPEREILVWEDMAKAYMHICSHWSLTKKQKVEVFDLILNRSSLPEKLVLQKIQLKTLSKKQAKFVLSKYKGIPQPILIWDNLGI